MDMLKKPLAIILGLTAIVVLFHFLFEPLYEDSIDTGQVWDILDFFMAFSAVVALAATFADKRRVGSGENHSIKEYIAVNAAFYAAALLAIWLFWNWIDNITVGEVQSDRRLIFWGFINPLFIIVTTVASVHLWHDDPTSRE